MRILVLILLALATLGAVPPATFTGTIIDAECARVCVLTRDSAFVLDAGTAVYLLSEQETAGRLAAQKVIVVGTVDPKTRTIQVESMAAAK